MKLVALLLLAFFTFQTLANTEIKHGLLAVVNKSDNSISIIDTKDKRIIKTLPTGLGPHELVLSSNSQWAVSTDFVGGDSLTVFDLNKLTVARRIALPDLPGPHGIRFLDDNEHVVFTSGKSQHLGIVNIGNGEVVARIKTGQDTTHMLAFNASKSIAYVSNIRSSTISVVDLQQQSIIKNISTEAMPEAINYRKASNELWYGANKEGKVLVIDPETEALIAQWEGFSFPYRVLFNHDETLAVVPDFRQHELRFFDAVNKRELDVLALESESGPQGVTLHPSQDIVFLSLNLGNKIVAIDMHTREVLDEFPTGNNPDGVIFWHP